MTTVDFYGLLRSIARQHLAEGRTSVADVFFVAAYWLVAMEREERALEEQHSLF